VSDKESSKKSQERQHQQKRQLDAATIDRRNEIFDKIAKRKRIKDSGEARYKESTYESVVNEFKFEADSLTLFDVVRNFFRSGRRLKPVVKQKRPKAPSEVSKSTLNVHIIRGKDVPIRVDFFNQYVEERAKSKDDFFKDMMQIMMSKPQVQPYIEVKYYDPDTKKTVVKRTQTSDGQCPEFNQILDFALEPKDGRPCFTRDELKDSKAVITITLFDEQKKHDPVGKRVITYHENIYLGHIDIPLTSILATNKLEGYIQVNRPLVLQNYHVVNDQLMLHMNPDKLQQQFDRPDEEKYTYLYVSIALEPWIRVEPSSEFQVFAGVGHAAAEKTAMRDGGKSFMEWYYEQYPKERRFCKLFFENIEGQSVFVSKFIRPQAPPSEEADGFVIFPRDSDKRKRAIERAARFVSLIPFMDDGAMFQDLPDMTCTSQEFLDLGAGDDEEHAILLCNYFNYIDDQLAKADQVNDRGARHAHYESYLLYGDAVTRGTTWWVCRRDR
jgi:coiled-coil and C2 domain-containing protein 2A